MLFGILVLAKLGFNNAVIASVDETDGLRITLTDKCIVHLRPSGNAPEFRCYVEAESFSDASDCVKQTLKHLNDL
jgi:phosphomannomutase